MLDNQTDLNVPYNQAENNSAILPNNEYTQDYTTEYSTIGEYTYKNETYEVPEDEMELYKEYMHSSVYLVVFKKKNEEKREILVTLSRSLIEKLTGKAYEVDNDGLFATTEQAEKMHQADIENGYVNVFDVALKDFRKINRKKVYLMEKVADDSLPVAEAENSSEDGVKSLEELIKLYNIRTTPSTPIKRTNSSSGSKTTTKRKRVAKPKQPKISVLDAMFSNYGTEEERAQAKENIEKQQAEYEKSVEEYNKYLEEKESEPAKSQTKSASKRKSDDEADTGYSAGEVETPDVKPESKQASKLIGLFGGGNQATDNQISDNQPAEKTELDSKVDGMFSLN